MMMSTTELAFLSPSTKFRNYAFEEAAYKCLDDNSAASRTILHEKDH